jgi:hypothetical protein
MNQTKKEKSSAIKEQFRAKHEIATINQHRHPTPRATPLALTHRVTATELANDTSAAVRMAAAARV